MNTFVGQTFQMNQLINIKQVALFIEVGRSTLYELMDEDFPFYGLTFPKKVQIT